MGAIERADKEHSVEVEASADAVWQLISDVTRTPEWSPVVQRSEWVGTPAAPVGGARFRGHNRFNGFRWSRDCVVTEAVPSKVFAFSTFGKAGEEQTRWRYLIERGAAGRTRLSLAYEVVSLPRWVRLLRYVPGGARVSDQQATRNLEQSLARVVQVVGGGRYQSSSE